MDPRWCSRLLSGDLYWCAARSRAQCQDILHMRDEFSSASRPAARPGGAGIIAADSASGMRETTTCRASDGGL